MSQSDQPPSAFPDSPGRGSNDHSADPDPHHSADPDPHHALNNPVGEPDPTEWPDPYDQRPDPRDPHDPDADPLGSDDRALPGSVSTSEPHPKQDPEAQPWAEGPKRDKVDR